MGVKLIVVAAMLAAGIVGVVGTRPAEGDPGQTLRFVAAPPSAGDQKQIDVPPAGLSLGDESIGALSLRHHGALVGRALVECTINDKTFQGQQCTLDLVLRTGLITTKTAGLDRLLPHQAASPNDAFAVTGGTGAYAGANGVLTIHHGAQADILTVQLM